MCWFGAGSLRENELPRGESLTRKHSKAKEIFPCTIKLVFHLSREKEKLEVEGKFERNHKREKLTRGGWKIESQEQIFR